MGTCENRLGQLPLSCCAAGVAGGIHASFLNSVARVIKTVNALTFDLAIYPPNKGWKGKEEYSRNRKKIFCTAQNLRKGLSRRIINCQELSLHVCCRNTVRWMCKVVHSRLFIIAKHRKQAECHRYKMGSINHSLSTQGSASEPRKRLRKIYIFRCRENFKIHS